MYRRSIKNKEEINETTLEEIEYGQVLMAESKYRGKGILSSEKLKKGTCKSDQDQQTKQIIIEKVDNKRVRKGRSTSLYRSRVTSWWRLNQNPKIGQQWKKPTVK